MPPCKVLAVRDQAIGAGLGQPVHLVDGLGRKYQAIRHQALALLIVRASASPEIQQAAGHIGVAHLAGILVLQLVQAALAAAVAQQFPFRRGHVLGRLVFQNGSPVLMTLRSGALTP